MCPSLFILGSIFGSREMCLLLFIVPNTIFRSTPHLTTILGSYTSSSSPLCVTLPFCRWLLICSLSLDRLHIFFIGSTIHCPFLLPLFHNVVLPSWDTAPFSTY